MGHIKRVVVNMQENELLGKQTTMKIMGESHQNNVRKKPDMKVHKVQEITKTTLRY